MKSKLMHNLGLKIMAVLISVVLWMNFYKFVIVLILIS